MSNAVTEKMVEAAKAAYWHEVHNGGGYSDKCYEAAIAAALTIPSPDSKDLQHTEGVEPPPKLYVRWALVAKDDLRIRKFSKFPFEFAVEYSTAPHPPVQVPVVKALEEIISRFEKAYPDLYWHVAKGKICAGEPLYGAIITTLGGTEIGHGESDVSAYEAFYAAVRAAGLTLPAFPAPSEDTP